AAAVKAMEPRSLRAPGPDLRAVPPFGQFETALHQATGLKLRDDLLAHLGSRVVLYTFPTKMNAPTSVLAGLAHSLIVVPKSAVVVEVKDREAMARALDTLAQHAGRSVPVLPNSGGGLSVSVTMGPMQRLKGPDTGYVFPPSSSSLPFPAGVRPTLLLG